MQISWSFEIKVLGSLIHSLPLLGYEQTTQKRQRSLAGTRSRTSYSASRGKGRALALEAGLGGAIREAASGGSATTGEEKDSCLLSQARIQQNGEG